MSSYASAATVRLFSFPLSDQERFEQEEEKKQRDQVDLNNSQLSLEVLRERFLPLYNSMVRKYQVMPGVPIEIVAFEDRFLMTFYPPETTKTIKCHWCSHRTHSPRYLKLQHLQSVHTVEFTTHTIHEITQHLFFALNVRQLAEVLELIPSRRNYEVVYGNH